MPLSAADDRPRDAEHALLYRVIAEHLDALVETAKRHADGASMPDFVEQEFRDFLTCGVWRWSGSISSAMASSGTSRSGHVVPAADILVPGGGTELGIYLELARAIAALDSGERVLFRPHPAERARVDQLFPEGKAAPGVFIDQDPAICQSVLPVRSGCGGRDIHGPLRGDRPGGTPFHLGHAQISFRLPFASLPELQHAGGAGGDGERPLPRQARPAGRGVGVPSTVSEQLLDEMAMAPQRLAQGVAEDIPAIRLATPAGGREPIRDRVQQLPGGIAR